MTSKNSGDASVIAQNYPDPNLNHANLGPPKTLFTRFLGLFSFFCFLLASSIHTLAQFSIFPIGKDFLISQIVIIILFYFFVEYSNFYTKKDSIFMKILNLFPNLITFFIGIVLIIYVAINVLIFAPRITPTDQKNSKYYSYPLRGKGQPQEIIEISESEFILKQNDWTRMSSSHWPLLFYLSTISFLIPRAKIRD